MEATAEAGMRRAIGVSRRLGLLGFCATGAILLSMAVMLRLSYQDTTSAAARTAENVLSFVMLEVADAVGTVETALVDLWDALQSPAVAALPPAEFQRMMTSRAERSKHVGALAVVNADGMVELTSSPMAPVGLNVGGHDYFTAQRSRPDGGLYISQPFANIFGAPSVALSLRRSRPDGAFEGIVIGILPLASISDMMGAAQLGPNGKISLLRDDGVLLAHTRMSDGPVDVTQAADRSDPLARLFSQPAGTLDAADPVDGLARRYIYATVPDLPLRVAVSLGVADIYAQWRQRAIGIAAVTLVSCAAILTLTLLFRRELLRRATAETQLAEMATVDGLTGIANRRRFDERLGQEWRRSYRAMRPVGLIMIDVDNFKAFNDKHGHWRGDELLIHIAAVLSRASRRPGDLCARYGGEEFAVILPETGREAAARIAEQIRAAIAATGIEDSTGRVVGTTASLGVAAMVPRPDTDKGTLVQLADAALYTAKDSGRNRVMMAPDESAVLPPIAEAS